MRYSRYSFRRALIAITFLFVGLVHITAHLSVVRATIEDNGIDEPNGETLTTNPKSRSMTVTAKVVDVTPPSIPLLVAPSDTSILTTTTPTFIWQLSTDEQGMGKYQLWLDGSLLYDNIPLTSTTNDSYTLVFEDGEYKLTPKTGLGQGSHTWYVKAFDIYDNSSTSATWSFTIDTVGPLIVVTNVGSTTQNIRSDNSGSVPLTPIRLSDNEPVISGTGESGSTLQMTLVIPGHPNQITTITLTSSSWSFTLPVLPIDTIVYVSFTSSDAVGNTSVITNIPIMVESAVIIIPLPSPIIIEVPRIVEIINTPTEEKRPEIIREILRRAPLPLQTFLETQLAQTIAQVIPFLALAAPALVVVATAVQTSFSLLPLLLEFLSRLLQSLGLIPVKRPRGVVFDTKSGKPIAFATVTFIRVSDNEIVDTVISDTSGIYRSVKLPIDTYRIEVIHSDYVFPTKLTPKFLVNPHDFYRGEPFEIKSANQEELFLIPMDPLYEETVKKHAFYAQITLSFIRRVIHSLFYPMVLFSVIVTLFYPTLLNIAIVTLYAVMITYRYSRTKKQPLLSGFVIDRNTKPLVGVMIKCFETGTNQVSALLVADDEGKFQVNLPVHQYNLLVSKDGYVIEQKSQDYTNIFLTHTGKEGKIIIHMMTVDQAFPETKPGV